MKWEMPMSLELSESDMEEIISKHPEMVEGDLMLKGRQVYVSGLRIDLLFEDKFGDRLIVELKKGTVTRRHVAQLMEYSGAIPEKQRSVTRVMLVANVVPPRWKKALDVHGIEYRELTNRDYIEFLKERDPNLLEKFRKRLSQPIGQPERELPRSEELNLITTSGHKYGILWSHNTQKYPGWLLTVRKAIDDIQGFIWWDVGWRVKAGLFPPRTTGFICSKALITHEASIAIIIPQPNEKQVMEVAENFEKLYELGVYRPPYDRQLAPLYQYKDAEGWKGKKKSLTLLKITELRRLTPQRKVTNLILAKTEEAVKGCPRGYSRVLF